MHFTLKEGNHFFPTGTFPRKCPGCNMLGSLTPGQAARPGGQSLPVGDRQSADAQAEAGSQSPTGNRQACPGPASPGADVKTENKESSIIVSEMHYCASSKDPNNDRHTEDKDADDSARDTNVKDIDHKTVCFVVIPQTLLALSTKRI